MLTVETSHSKVMSSSPAVGKNFSFFMLSKTLRIDQNTCSRGGGGCFDVLNYVHYVYILLFYMFSFQTLVITAEVDFFLGCRKQNDELKHIPVILHKCEQGPAKICMCMIVILNRSLTDNSVIIVM